MTNSASFNRTLFLEDNLPVLRGLDSDSIDLIATDPPFNKGVPAFKGKTKAGQNVEFKDVWNWDEDVHDGWMEQMSKRHPTLSNVILYANAAAGDDMGAFLCWMGVRVLEMHRVLKPTGSIYLHCDPTASHYLKAMMDAIFGRKNFRNEIVWKRQSAHSDGSGFGKVADVILFYGTAIRKDNVRVPLSKEQLKAYRYEDERGRYTPDNISAKGLSGGGYNYEFYGHPGPWRYPEKRARELDKDGRIHVPPAGGVPRLKRYLHEHKGVVPGSIWTDIPPVQSHSKERTGYPTQKPLALYKRMIAASSNPGDMVLDPFAGCATTCVAAEQLGRQWIGIDIREESGGVIRERLEREVSESMAWDAIVRTPTTAPERTDDGEPAAPELLLESSKRNARKIPVQEARRLLIERDGQRCQGCGWQPEYADYLQVDHKKPKTLKGKDDMTNYALLCDPCNRKKSNKMALSELRRARLDEGRIDAKWYEERARWE